MTSIQKCKICGKQAVARLLCRTHYNKFWQAGTLEQHRPIQLQNVPFEKCYKITERGCWIWTRGLLKTGYATLTREGRHWRAHRYSYLRFKGKIPRGLDVMHTCDDRACVNPAHLAVGTRKENMQDAKQKGRLRTGERHPGAKLTQEKAQRIRELARTMPYKKIAAAFGVTPSTICAVVKRYERGGWRD